MATVTSAWLEQRRAPGQDGRDEVCRRTEGAYDESGRSELLGLDAAQVADDIAWP